MAQGCERWIYTLNHSRRVPNYPRTYSCCSKFLNLYQLMSYIQHCCSNRTLPRRKTGEAWSTADITIQNIYISIRKSVFHNISSENQKNIEKLKLTIVGRISILGTCRREEMWSVGLYSCTSKLRVTIILVPGPSSLCTGLYHLCDWSTSCHVLVAGWLSGPFC